MKGHAQKSNGLIEPKQFSTFNNHFLLNKFKIVYMLTDVGFAHLTFYHYIFNHGLYISDILLDKS